MVANSQQSEHQCLRSTRLGRRIRVPPGVDFNDSSATGPPAKHLTSESCPDSRIPGSLLLFIPMRIHGIASRQNILNRQDHLRISRSFPCFHSISCKAPAPIYPAWMASPTLTTAQKAPGNPATASALASTRGHGPSMAPGGPSFAVSACGPSSSYARS